MKFDEFSDYVCRHLSLMFEERGEKVEVNKNSITKNNGYELTAVTVLRDNCRVSPTLYIEEYYNIYNDGGNLNQIMDDIFKFFNEENSSLNIDVDSYLNFEEVKNNIVLRLVSRDKNENILMKVPYLPYLDMIITFRWVVEKTTRGISSALVSNCDMKRWNVNIQQLYEAALINTMNMFPLHVENLYDMLCGRYNIEICDDVRNVRGQLFIITNDICINGATAVLYPGALERCFQMAGGNVYIMPSSIHEMLFVLADSIDSPDTLKELVSEANRAVVHCTEVLSDNIYYYDYNRKTLDIVH